MATKLCPYCAEEIQAEALKCKHCNSWLSGPGQVDPQAGYVDPQTGYAPPAASSRLTRSTSNRMLAGVCGGVARWVGIDPTLLRVAVVLVTFFTVVMPGIIVYIILTFVIPSDDSLGM